LAPLQPVVVVSLFDLPRADLSDPQWPPRAPIRERGFCCVCLIERAPSGTLTPGCFDLDQRKVARATYELATKICERED